MSLLLGIILVIFTTLSAVSAVLPYLLRSSASLLSCQSSAYNPLFVQRLTGRRREEVGGCVVVAPTHHLSQRQLTAFARYIWSETLGKSNFTLLIQKFPSNKSSSLRRTLPSSRLYLLVLITLTCRLYVVNDFVQIWLVDLSVCGECRRLGMDSVWL
jgi:hypothetical protein